MGNNGQLYIFLLIAAVTLIQWIGKQVKDQREVRQINEARRKMRETGVMETPTPASVLAEQRKEHLQKMRDAHRTQSQDVSTRVQTGLRGQRAQRAPVATRPARAPRPQTPTPAPRQPSQRINRRPLRPGRSARGVQPVPAPVAVPERKRTAPRVADHTVLGVLDHRALPSEGGVATETVVVREQVSGIDWKRAIVLSEILAPPVSMRPPTEE